MVERDRRIKRLYQTFGETLRKLREERGLSQEDLGFESGYHRTYISLLERGKKAPSLTALFHLASVLHVKPSGFIERVEARLRLD